MSMLSLHQDVVSHYEHAFSSSGCGFLQLDNVLLINLLIPTPMAAPLTLSATNILQQTAANARSLPKTEALCHCFPVMNCHFTPLHCSSGRETERQRERPFSLAAILGVTASQRKEAQSGCVPLSSIDDTLQVPSHPSTFP